MDKKPRPSHLSPTGHSLQRERCTQMKVKGWEREFTQMEVEENLGWQHLSPTKARTRDKEGCVLHHSNRSVHGQTARCRHAKECDSAATQGETLPSAATRMGLEGIVLSERSEGDRQTPRDFVHVWNLRNKINEQTK